MTYDRSGETDELELGERASTWLLLDEVGQCYSTVKDRVWAVVIGCFAKVCRSDQILDQRTMVTLQADWMPQLDKDGMWHMPGEEKQ